MTINQAIEQYILSRRKKFSENSIRTYSRVLKRFAKFIGGDKPLKSIKEVEIDQFQLEIQGNSKPNTQLNYANIIRAFFKFWVQRGEVDLIYEAIEGPRRVESVPNFISSEQFALIDDFLDDSEFYSLTQKLIFNLLWDTGMRIGEMIGLDISDIDSTKNHAAILTEKSKRNRIVVWSPATHELLLKYLGVRICLNNDQALFQTPRHRSSNPTRLTCRSVQRWCKKLEEELGFPINPHAFRHGKMHEIINNGGTRQHVQTVAGHGSIMSSEVYVRLNESEQLKIQGHFLELQRKPRLNVNIHKASLQNPRNLP